MRQKDQKHEEPQPAAEVPKVNSESQPTKEQNAQPEGPKMDIHKKINLLKDHHEDFEKHIAHIKHQPRKPINIPICDVRIDHDYNEHVSATYTPPISYVKYIKSIGDDMDLTIDYHADADDLKWIATMSHRFGTDSLTIAKFEQLINLLEKTNGTMRDTILPSTAAKALTERSGLEPALVSKLSPELYKLWVAKREKIGKPLVRKYWPPVIATDTNPHQVFRVRDKERYRLRRHRKNDLESFRKMQQLRKEFLQAKSILQLMLERELMNEANFKLEREIFERRIKEMEKGLEDYPKSVIDETEEKPFEFHEPKFKHLWIQSLTKSSSYEKLPENESLLNIKDYDDNGSVSEVGSTLTSRKSLLKNPKEVGLDSSFDKTKRLSAGGNNNGNAAAGGVGRRRKQKDKMILYTVNNNGVVEIVNIENPHANYRKQHDDNDLNINYLGFTVPSILEFNTEQAGYVNTAGNSSTAVDTSTDSVNPPPPVRSIHEQVEGPRYVCNPQWPNFTQYLPCREQISHESSALEYLESLELKTDEMNQEHLAPTKYRSRYRIGRGGRLVVDRIPVYNETIHDSTTMLAADDGVNAIENRNQYLFQYPVMLPTNPLPMNTMNTSQTAPGPGPVTAAPSSSHKQSQKNSLLTTNALAQLNTENQLKTNAPTVASATAVPMDVTTQQLGSSAPLFTKPLPEIPLSNRRLLISNKKNNKNLFSTYSWSNALPTVFSQFPAMVPPPRPLLSSEKARRLNEILAQSDSEDEKIVIPRSSTGIDIERNITNKAVATEQAMTKFVFQV